MNSLRHEPLTQGEVHTPAYRLCAKLTIPTTSNQRQVDATNAELNAHNKAFAIYSILLSQKLFSGSPYAD